MDLCPHQGLAGLASSQRTRRPLARQVLQCSPHVGGGLGCPSWAYSP